MAAQLRLQLLGKPTLYLDDIAVTGFTSAKVMALMIYLAVTARPHTRDALATLLWSQSADDAEAKTNLRQALANLRKLGLASFLHIERESVGIDKQTDITTDIAKLHTLNSQPINLDDDLAALYKGDFLEGFNLKDAPEFDEWVLMQREHWRETAFAWLHRAIEVCATKRNYERGVTLAKHILALDIWREEAHRWLMLFLAKQGQRSAALAQFEHCKTILQKTFNIAPSHETIALYERIKLANTLSRSNLPTAADVFIGRHNDLQILCAQLRVPTRRWLSIVGVGGMGKSRLAIEVARRLNNDFLNGVFFAGLNNANSLDDVIHILAQAFLSLNSVKNPRQSLLNYLRDKEILLILDNFETLLHHPQTQPILQLLNELLNTCTGLKILATSRERVGLRVEAIHLLDGMSFPAATMTINDLQTLSSFTASLLFLQKTPPTLVLSDPAELQAIATICRLVNGMPLGVELAAAWARVLSCQDIACEIERSIDFVASSMSDAPPQQCSIRAIFDSSWARLSQPEQAVFVRLGLFQGGFSRRAAEYIAHANVGILSSLLDKCFIKRQGPDRYSVHELMRQFAVEILNTQTANRHETDQRFACFFINDVIGLKTQLRNKDQLLALHHIQTDIYNVRLAWSILVSQLALAQLNEAIQPIADYYYLSGLYSDVIDLFYDTLERLSNALPPITQSDLPLFKRIHTKLNGHLVYFYFWISNYGEMRKRIHETLKYCDEQSSEVCAFAYNGVGLASARGLGDPITAKKYLDHGLALALAGNYSFELGWAYFGLSLWAYDQGDYVNAVKNAHASMTVRAAIGDTINYAKALNLLGNAENFLGNYENATLIFAEIIQVMAAAGNESGVDQARYNLGLTHYFLGMYAEAVDDFQLMLNYGLQMGDVNNMTLALNGMAMVRNEQAQFHAALELSQRGIDECNKYDEWYAKVYLQQTLGQAYLHLNALNQAKQAFAAGLALGLARGLVPGVLHNLLGWAGYFLKLGNHDAKAYPLLRQVAAHRGSINFSRKRALTLLSTLTAPPNPLDVSPDASIADLAQLAHTLGLF